MTTDEEKSKLGKLLREIEIPEVKLTERCSELVKEFHKRFASEVETEMEQDEILNEVSQNPYKVDPQLLGENERKLRELLSGSNRMNVFTTNTLTAQDAKRPWRTNSNKEKLSRIDGELKRHFEKSSQLITPLAADLMQNLIKECREETRVAPPVRPNRLRATVESAKKNLPNFQYKNTDNSTATAIMLDAHDLIPKNTQH